MMTQAKPAGHQTSSYRGIGAAILLSLVVTAIFLFSFSSILFSGDATKLVGLGDAHHLNSPTQFFLDLRIAAGDLPLWNPHTLSGTPFAAHPLSMAFYPPNLARSILTQASTPEDTILSLFGLVLFHLVLAAVGLFALARREGLSVGTSTLVALAVPFSNVWIDMGVEQLPALCTAAWSPLILVTLHCAIGSRIRRRALGWLAAGGILYGLQILGGWPQTAMYATILYVAYVALHVTLPSADHKFSIATAATLLLKWSGPMVFFGLLGATVAMAHILPATELMGLSARSLENFEHYEKGKEFVNLLGFDIFREFLKLAQADVFHRARAMGGTLDMWISVNIGMLILVPAAVFARPRRLALIHGSLLYLLFDLCLGTPMPFATLFEIFSPFAISTPMYNAILINVPLAMVAGIGLDAIFARARTKTLSRGEIVYLAAVAIVPIVLMTEPPTAYYEWNFRWSLLPAGILLFIYFCSSFRHWQRLVLALLLFETIVCSLKIVTQIYSPPTFALFSQPFVSDPSVLTSAPPHEVSRARVTCEFCNHHMWSQVSAINGYDPLILDQTIRVLSNPNQEDTYGRGVEVPRNIQAAALLKRRYWLVPAFVKGPPPSKTRLYPPTLAAFFPDEPDLPLTEITLQDLPEGSLAEPAQATVVWDAEVDEVTNPTPGVQDIHVAGLKLSPQNSALFIDYTSEVSALLTLRVEGSGPQELYVVELEAPVTTGAGPSTLELPLPDFSEIEFHLYVQFERGPPVPLIGRLSVASDNADESMLIHVIESTPDRTVLEVRDAPGPRALVFTDMMYPGWEAWVDGQPAPILLAHGAFKAVVVPEGTHEVRFEFRPPRVLAGVITSLIALVAGLVVLLWSFSPRRKSVPPDHEATPYHEGL